MSRLMRFVMSLIVMVVLVNFISPASSFAAEKGRSAYDAIINDENGLNLEADEEKKTNQTTTDTKKEITNENSNDDAKDSNEMFKEDTNVGILLVKLAFYTILVVVMIYGLVKFMSSRQRKFQHNQLFKTLGGAPFGANKSLQLVEVGGKMYLIGIGEDINLIDKITDIEQAKKIVKDLDEHQSVITKNMKDLIKQKFQPKGNVNSTISTEPEQTTNFNQLFQQTIENQRLKRQELERSLQD